MIKLKERKYFLKMTYINDRDVKQHKSKDKYIDGLEHHKSTVSPKESDIQL